MYHTVPDAPRSCNSGGCDGDPVPAPPDAGPPTCPECTLGDGTCIACPTTWTASECPLTSETLAIGPGGSIIADEDAVYIGLSKVWKMPLPCGPLEELATIPDGGWWH
jgi:hypothetical protein